MHQIGPHSRPHKLAVVDGRTAEAKRMKQIRQELLEHLGGSASATQRMMIDRACVLTLRLELMDRRALRDGAIPETDSRQYFTCSNALSRLLRQIGLKGASQRPPTLADLMNRPRDAA